MAKGSIIKTSGGHMTETAKSDYTMYADKIQSNAARKIIEYSNDGIIYGEPLSPPIKVATDFDIKIEFLKKEKTFLPLGILDYKGKSDNKLLYFKVIITGKGVQQWQLSIKKEDKIIYIGYSATFELKTVEIKGESKRKDEDKKKSTTEEINSRFWPAGEYEIIWDGFDNEGIYNSKLLTDDGNFTAVIQGQANYRSKYAVTDPFSFNYAEVQWVDLMINKINKRIDVTLRVELEDGGSKGIEPIKMGGMADPNRTINPWDYVPAETIAIEKKEPYKGTIRSFEELKKLTLFGLTAYWSRNQNKKIYTHTDENIKINNEPYNVFVNAIDTKKNALNSVDLVFNTNGDWDRSGNPGILAKLSYNAGYIKYSNGWGYQEPANEDMDFSFTAAHEIGHPILQAYRGYGYSWQHKGSSYLVPQDTKPTPDESTISKAWKDATHMDQYPYISGEYYPESGEIDLMKYYKQKINKTTGRPEPVLLKYQRSVAAQEDVLGLLWLTKLEIK